MEDLKEVMTEITKLTTDIETNYPELYDFLEEDPMTIPSSDHPDIGIEVMREYLDGLKQLLDRYLEGNK